MARSGGLGVGAVLVGAAALGVGALVVMHARSASAAPQLPPAPAPLPMPAPAPAPASTAQAPGAQPVPAPLVTPAPSLPAAVTPPTAPPPAPPTIPAVPLLPLPNLPTVSTTQLQAGHRYSVAQLAPVAGVPVATVAEAQALFDAVLPGAVRVASIGGTPTTVVFDVLQAIPMTLPSTMPITDVGASPLPASGGTPAFTTVVTDPNVVRQYQTVLANALANMGAAQELGIPSSAYLPSMVTGNASDPAWTSVLSTYQKYVNPLLPGAAAAGALVPGFPAQLRTDGVLDYATAMSMMNM